MHVTVPSFAPIPRTVWDMKFAKWDELRDALRAPSWRHFVEDDIVDDAVANFVAHLEQLANQYVPKKVISMKPKEHPWIDENCFAAVEAKCLATGTDEFFENERKCSELLTAAYLRCQHELRERLLSITTSLGNRF